MRELRREISAIFRHWLVGAVAVTVATAVSSVLFVPPAHAAFGERALAAAGGAVVGLLVVGLAALVVALIRSPLGEYRERHRLRQIGQGYMDVAYEMIYAAGPLKKAPDGDYKLANRDDESALMATYNTKFASQVFHASRELEKLGELSRDQREQIDEAPHDLRAYFARVIALVDLANRLGAEHPPNRAVELRLETAKSELGENDEQAIGEQQ